MEPIPMLLFCPMCNTRHIDEGEFATKPHHTHACQNMKCGMVWRPAIVLTVGVAFLPGFNNAWNKLEAMTTVDIEGPEHARLARKLASMDEPVLNETSREARVGTSLLRADTAQASILLEVLGERTKQITQWGGASHDDGHTRRQWLAYIAKQVNRATQRRTGERKQPVTPEEYRSRLVKIAALAVAATESFDRRARIGKDNLK